MKGEYFENQYPLEELLPKLTDIELHDFVFEHDIDVVQPLVDVIGNAYKKGYEFAQQEINKKLRPIKKA